MTVSFLPKGTEFTRVALAVARAKGLNPGAVAHAAAAWGPKSALVVKSAVSALNTTDDSALADYRSAAREFVTAIRPGTILGKLAGFRSVPQNIKVPRATAGTTQGWVGEGRPIKVSRLALDTLSIGILSLGGIVVTSKELANNAQPAAEELVRQDLIASARHLTDVSFIDPAAAGELKVQPPSITYGATNFAASGTTASALRADLRQLFRLVTDAGINLEAPVLITDRKTAIGLALIDSPLTEGVTVNGGMLAGVPLITSASVPPYATPDSPATYTGYIVLVDAAELMVCDQDEIEIDLSQQATLQLDDTPDSPVSAGTNLVNLFQHGLVAWRCIRGINWKMRRDGAVAYITNAAYGE